MKKIFHTWEQYEVKDCMMVFINMLEVIEFEGEKLIILEEIYLQSFSLQIIFFTSVAQRQLAH